MPQPLPDQQLGLHPAGQIVLATVTPTLGRCYRSRARAGLALAGLGLSGTIIGLGTLQRLAFVVLGLLGADGVVACWLRLAAGVNRALTGDARCTTPRAGCLSARRLATG
jgi:hypothetical protein